MRGPRTQSRRSILIQSVVDAVQVPASLFSLLIAAVNKNTVTVIRSIHALCNATRQNPSPLDVCIGTAADLVTCEEGHKAYAFRVVTWILVAALILVVALILIVEAIKVAAGLTSLLITSVDKNPVAVIRSIHALGDTTRQKLGTLNVCIGTTANLITREESHKTYEFLVVALIAIVEASKVAAGLTSPLIASVDKNTVAVIWPIQALCHTKRQQLRTLDVCVSTSAHLIAPEKGHKTD